MSETSLATFDILSPSLALFFLPKGIHYGVAQVIESMLGISLALLDKPFRTLIISSWLLNPQIATFCIGPNGGSL